MTISWLEALRFLDTEVTQETAIATDAASSSEDGRSESLTQQGDKSAKRGGEGLLALLSLPHIRDFAACSACENVKLTLIKTQRP